MAQPHRLAGNGIDIETALSLEQVINLAHRAALASTGNPEERHRITPVRTSDRQLEYRVSDHEVSFRKLMVFHLDLDPGQGVTRAASRIDWYLTTQPKLAGLIPFGGKVMVAHRTYLQFVHNLAREVSTADPGARITLREGPAAGGQRPGQVPQEERPEPVTEPAAPEQAPATPGAVAAGVPVVESFGPVGAAASAPPAAPAPAAPPPLVTAVPGMPVRQPGPAAESAPFSRPVADPEPPGRLASLAEQLFAEDEDLHATRIAQQGEGARPWLFTLPDGSTVRLVADVVVGRNPVAPPSAPAATPVGLQDPQRSVSKTHALVELRDGLPWVTDLHSTNGTTLTNDVGEAFSCEPEVALPVGDGWRIGFGDYEIKVARA